MWRSRLLWKLLLAYCGLHVIAAAALAYVATAGERSTLTEHLRERLKTATMILSEVFPTSPWPPRPSTDLQETIRRVGEITGLRLTLIGAEGSVLADSEKTSPEEVEEMENLLDREEIQQAIRAGQAEALRRSGTDDHPVLFFVRRLGTAGKESGFVRAAASTGLIEQQLAGTRWRIWLIMLAVSTVAVAIILGVVRSTLHRVDALTSLADTIATGDYTEPNELHLSGDLDALAGALRRIQHSFRQRIVELQRNSERLATVLGGMNEGVIAIGSKGQLLLANTAARNLLDLPTLPVEGAVLADVFPDLQLRRTVSQILRKPAARRLTFEEDGAMNRVIEINVTPMPGDPCPGVVLVLHDETELRRLESLRQEFVANVSHELKTPLSSIKAYAETLSQGAINDRANNLRFVARIEEQADRLHQLILDLLHLARIESGEQSFDIGAVPIAGVIDACLADHRTAADAKKIQLVCESPGTDLLVRFDEEGLRQILDNLVDNAIKYTPEGGRVTLRYRREAKSVRLVVEDTGIGIPQELQPRVFERFFRVDKARSRELGGTGLGLSIVKHLVQSIGGSVSVHSVPGKGSTFVVELPAFRMAEG